MADFIGARIHITGIVQGVGFRPFVYALARRLDLKGWVRNTSAGVDIQVDGNPAALDAFARALAAEAPPLARLDSLEVETRPSQGFVDFEIIHSEAIAGAFQPISPDVTVCNDCLRELFDPSNRRYLYPFINCTNCGPRFTIIEDIPYDRPKTTMAAFQMCPDCAAEYTDPLDRRFHAQPIACPVCGPKVWLEFPASQGNQASNSVRLEKASAIFETQCLLQDGKIVAIKGLGGFHLACDASNPQAVAELRRRKLRVDKPFALMKPDLAEIESDCFVSPAERELLESPQRPIVILDRRPGSRIALEVSPGQSTVGVMLPYTPLHSLLFASEASQESGFQPVLSLVMTSGNLSEEPIATSNEEARERLSSLADAFLMHDRPIRTRCDDSVMRSFRIPASAVASQNPASSSTLMPVRRSRGYAPFPIHLLWEVAPLLAVGAELKNTFCIARQRYAFLSHHIGDLENYETMRSFEDGVQHFEHLFRLQPQALAYDLHPDYLATRYALERAEAQSLPAIGVQHHHAHIAACMVEHGLDGSQPVIGVAFDGAGYGTDGAIWGGEILVADYLTFQRPYHLSYVPLPGGDKAVREPWRMALAWLKKAGIPWSENLPPVQYALQHTPNPSLQLEALRRQLQTGLNAPPTSSIGRLFDAVAALTGVKQVVNYEAQAAIELEALVDPGEEGAYPISVPKISISDKTGDNKVQSFETQEINPTSVLLAIVSDTLYGVSVPVIAARFHNTIAESLLQACKNLRSQTGIDQVALSGGVWQNKTLLSKTLQRLPREGFKVFYHQLVPANDGGLSLGQVVVAAQRLVAISN